MVIIQNKIIAIRFIRNFVIKIHFVKTKQMFGYFWVVTYALHLRLCLSSFFQKFNIIN